MTDDTDDSLTRPIDRLIDAMLDTVMTDGWSGVALDAVAAQAEIGRASCRERV